MSRFVMDQNYFRDADLQRRLENATEDDEFAMTDYAFIEMFKSPEWELTSRQSLAAIATHPERIITYRPPSDVLRSELTTRTPTVEWNSLVDAPLTERMREYLRELAEVGQSGPRHSIVSSMIAAAQSGIAVQQQNHEVNLQLLQNGVRTHQELLQGPTLDDLRAGRMPDRTRIQLAIRIATVSARTLLLEDGATELQANDFLASDSFLLRSQVSFCLLVIDKVSHGGINGMRPDRATNELMDIDYALFGSYCDGVLTREATVTRHHELLMLAVSLIRRDDDASVICGDEGTQ